VKISKERRERGKRSNRLEIFRHPAPQKGKGGHRRQRRKEDRKKIERKEEGRLLWGRGKKGRAFRPSRGGESLSLCVGGNSWAETNIPSERRMEVPSYPGKARRLRRGKLLFRLERGEKKEVDRGWLMGKGEGNRLPSLGDFPFQRKKGGGTTPATRIGRGKGGEARARQGKRGWRLFPLKTGTSIGELAAVGPKGRRT